MLVLQSVKYDLKKLLSKKLYSNISYTDSNKMY